MAEELTIARLGLARDALVGQVALVTGAGRGIGREVARALAYLGAAVVVAELDEASGRETAALVTAAGGQALSVPTDVAEAASVAALAERALASLGRVDILVNNAILCPVARVTEMDVTVWDRVLAVNLRGAFLTCRAFLPGMLARGSGTVVNMVSTDAMPGLAAYIASKQGLVGLTQSLAAEVGERGVHVVAFGPGMVGTPSLREAAPRLAPLLGMSAEQFLSLSLHPGYEGLMPAADAGAATAYLVARLAAEYHGEVIDGYAVLERAGYLQAPAVAASPAAPSAPAQGAGVAATRALDLARKLAEYVAQVDAEFGKLPLFARPMARGDFKGKAGQSAADWARTAAALVALLERTQAGDAAALVELRAQHDRLARLLQRFAAYCHAVPAGAARFTKDQAFLAEVARIAAEREATVDALRDALDEAVG